jgi:type VI protein secretion system component Hcp
MKASYLAGLFLIASVGLSPNVYADTEAFLCIPEIPGGTTDTRNPDCIDITSLSVDFSVDASYQMGGGGATATPVISPFSIEKTYDVASVLLQSHLVQIQTLPFALIRFFETCDECEPPEKPYLIYKLEEVTVTRHNISYYQGGPAISEIVDLSFAQYKICAGYDEPNADLVCDSEFGWDLRSNRPE